MPGCEIVVFLCQYNRRLLDGFPWLIHRKLIARYRPLRGRPSLKNLKVVANFGVSYKDRK